MQLVHDLSSKTWFESDREALIRDPQAVPPSALSTLAELTPADWASVEVSLMLALYLVPHSVRSQTAVHYVTDSFSFVATCDARLVLLLRGSKNGSLTCALLNRSDPRAPVLISMQLSDSDSKSSDADAMDVDVEPTRPRLFRSLAHRTWPGVSFVEAEIIVPQGPHISQAIRMLAAVYELAALHIGGGDGNAASVVVSIEMPKLQHMASQWRIGLERLKSQLPKVSDYPIAHKSVNGNWITMLVAFMC